MIKKAIFAIGLLLVICACVKKKEFVSYKPAKFEKLIQEGTVVQLVDVRRPDEYAAGHISNAVLINVQDSVFIERADSLLDKSKPVAVYCRSGKRSKDAANKLSKEGYKVYELDSGYLGWAEYRKTKNKD